MARIAILAATCLTPLPLLLRRLSPTLLVVPRPRIEMDTKGVRQILGEEVRERVDWEQLVKVSIITTDDGPYAEDLFWLLHAANGAMCLVPHHSACEADLLPRLQQPA